MSQILRGKLLPNLPASQRRRSSAAPIALLACLTSGATIPAYTPAQAEEKPGELSPVVVTSPGRQVAPRVQVQQKRAAAAVSVRRAQRQQAPLPAATSGAGAPSPLNSNAVAPGVSRLGVTVREIPATVEVIDQRTIREQGYRTVTEMAQGAVGVTAGDGPGKPAAFSMRGFSNSQLNILYNGIKIGPQNITSRYMDTANLEAVEILKGPSSLLSGEGASVARSTLSPSNP